MIGSPVIIEHQDVTDKNADKIRCGVISDAYFYEPDGWYYAEGIIWDEKAISLINDGWSVSCSYDFLAFNDEGGEENNIKYDKEFTELNFTHLAIVNNPRYERANIVFNSKDEEKGKWVTIKGNHIFIPDGKTLDEVIKEKGWGDKENKQSDKDRIKIADLKSRENEVLRQFYEAKDGSSEREHLQYELDALKDERFRLEDKQSDAKDGKEEKKSTFKPVKGIMQALKDDYETGKINAKEVAKELSKANLTPYLLDDNEALEKIGVKQSDLKGEKKYNYTLTKREVEGKKMLGGMADTGNYYTNGEFAIDKKYLNIKGQEPTKKEEIEKSLKSILKGNSTYRYTPVKDFEIGELKREYGKPIKVAKYSYYDEKYGYERNIYLNKKYNDLFKNFDLKFGDEAEPVFAYKGKDIVGVVMPINAREQSYSKTVNNEIEEELTEDKNQLKLKIDNSKEQDMTLLDELKKLITKVENNKENEEMIDNEKVDKRKLIDEVGGILKGKVDDEIIRTIIKKMEEASYNDSEASADNKKVKNEDDEEKKIDNEEDEKEEVKNKKKVKNEEDEEDEEKVEELKKEEKKDVENKCKNSKETSTFDKINAIYNSVRALKPQTKYTSRQEKLDNAVEYFKN